MFFPAGSLGPKVDATCDFVQATGNFAAIDKLQGSFELVIGETGTRISQKHHLQ